MEYGEHSFLHYDTRIECWTDNHARWAFGVGGFMLIAYALGIPLGALLALHSIKGELAKWRTTYGFLYASYTEPFWFWEMVVMLKKVAIVGSVVLLEPVGVDIQTITAVSVIVIALVLQLLFRPFVECD